MFLTLFALFVVASCYMLYKAEKNLRSLKESFDNMPKLNAVPEKASEETAPTEKPEESREARTETLREVIEKKRGTATSISELRDLYLASHKLFPDLAKDIKTQLEEQLLKLAEDAKTEEELEKLNRMSLLIYGTEAYKLIEQKLAVILYKRLVGADLEIDPNNDNDRETVRQTILEKLPETNSKEGFLTLFSISHGFSLNMIEIISEQINNWLLPQVESAKSRKELSRLEPFSLFANKKVRNAIDNKTDLFHAEEMLGMQMKK
jgi:hypothetical protein